MPSTNPDQALWEQEQLLTKSDREIHPELFILPNVPVESLQKRVGIYTTSTPLPKGYLKLSPLDFIVEEILKDDKVVEVIGNNPPLNPNMEGLGTIYASLIKVGISTLDAIERITKALELDFKNIGYAGIKDNVAVTGQRISIRGTTLEKVKNLKVDGVSLKDISEGKGAISMGELKGNRFTLLIRTETPLDETVLLERIKSVSSQGVINFYGAQRFGHPRYLSHYFGSLLLAGKYEDLIHAVICQTSPFEIPYVTNLRNSANTIWGNWQEIDKLYSTLPKSLNFERIVLDSLITNTSGNIWTNAMFVIREQIKFWARSYASYLANRLLSEKAKDIVTVENKDETIPLLLSQNPENQKPYEQKIQTDGTSNFRYSLRALPYMSLSRDARITVRIFPEFHQTKIIPQGVILCFSLPKGSYATTILASLFDIDSNSPSTVSKVLVDTKETLGQGSLSEIRTYFSDSLNQIEPNTVDSEEN